MAFLIFTTPILTTAEDAVIATLPSGQAWQIAERVLSTIFSPLCGPNADFSLCHACQTTCGAPNEACSTQCLRGCNCKTGYCINEFLICRPDES